MPENPGGQEQIKSLPFELHTPLLLHGADEHGVTSHVAPEYPVGQAQVNDPSTVECVHVPWFMHGAFVHGVTSQFVPE